MKNDNNGLIPQNGFYIAVFLVFILFLALFTAAMISVVGAFDTEAYSSSIAQL